MRILFSIIFSVGLLTSCAPKFTRVLHQKFVQTENTFQDHTGFYLYDLSKEKVVSEYKADRYFTPASNTKILTFYTCLTLLGDSLPAIRYVEAGDSLIFWGTGDPSFLNKYVYNSGTTYSFLKNSPRSLYFSATNFSDRRFGEGWAWDDYEGSYQPERSSFPIYSNLLSATFEKGEMWVEPSLFASRVMVVEPAKDAALTRDERTNAFLFQPSFSQKQEEFEVPFIVQDSLILSLLQDTLRREIRLAKHALPKEALTLYSTPADSVYKVMMQESDNFLAEQLLWQCSQIISDSLASQPAIRFMQRNHFSDLPDKIRWIDGSGLSRYNLFTPRSVAQVWKKIYAKLPAERLLPLLATGGVNGTVKNWYKAESPYIFGKTGTLANNHSLSGYLITRSGKTLIFSFMNSNYLASTSAIRSNMQEILEYIRDNY